MGSDHSIGPSIVPVECRLPASAHCLVHMGKPVVAVYGVVPVAAIVSIFPAGTYRHYRGTTTILWSSAIATRASGVKPLKKQPCSLGISYDRQGCVESGQRRLIN